MVVAARKLLQPKISKEINMTYKMHAPLDPECAEVESFMSSLFSDPMTAAMGAPTDDIVEGFERRHRKVCKRCQTFGAANMEVEG